MANDVKFEGKERRLAKIEKCLAEYGLSSLEEARDLCLSKGIDVDAIVKGVQPIAFENASWAYTLGVAVALKKDVKSASEAAAAIGIQERHYQRFELGENLPSFATLIALADHFDVTLDYLMCRTDDR